MARLAKIKPCPFCRDTDSFVECRDCGEFYVYCNNCGARGPVGEGEGCDPDSDNYRGHRNAVRKWNRRPRAASPAAEERK